MKPGIDFPANLIAPGLADCRRQFPALARQAEHGVRVFADNSSRAQMPEQTLAACEIQMLDWETQKGGQPTFDSPRAARAADLRTRARAVAVAFCGGSPEQIGFAANGTSTLAVLARALFGSVLMPGDTIVITEADHDANRHPWQALAKLGCHIVDVPVCSDGALDPKAWQAALACTPKLVALCMLSNVTGVLLPYESLAAQAQAVGAVVVLDAVQGPPHGHIDIMQGPIDIAVFSNCKLFSPHLGWWAIRPELIERMGLTPATGGHPALEWGTFAHASHAGFVATHDYLCRLASNGRLNTTMMAIRAHEALLTTRFIDQLPAKLWPCLLASETVHQRVPIFSLALPPRLWPVVSRYCVAAGVDVRIGQFGCPATLRRLAPHTEAAALRLSFVHYNTIADVDAVLAVLNQLAEEMP
jgi:selenocysteine lyase/cysteine desulfurase